MSQADRSKSPKGSVKAEYVDGYVRLRWRADGKRYAKNIGRNTPENRKVAEAKARQIELDIISGNFDPTLGCVINSAKQRQQPDK